MPRNATAGAIGQDHQAIYTARTQPARWESRSVECLIVQDHCVQIACHDNDFAYFYGFCDGSKTLLAFVRRNLS